MASSPNAVRKGVGGSAEIYNKTLTLVGQSGSGQKRATLDSRQQRTVRMVESGMVTLRSLVVTGGSEPDGAGWHQQRRYARAAEWQH